MENASVKVLDHGYVRLIESWGSDERIIEAARMSTNKGFEGWNDFNGSVRHIRTCPAREPNALDSMFQPGACNCEPKPGDEKLLRYLWEHKHHTPFEMGGMTIEVQAPIMVFREWHRHRTQSYNEMSARYVPLPDVNYVPDLDRILVAQKGNRQAQGVVGTPPLDRVKAILWQEALKESYRLSQSAYEEGLEFGVPKELARLCIPVGRYSRMRASANLRNWLAFLTLREDEHAQWEIQQYAKVVGQLVRIKFPRTAELFYERHSG